MVVRCCDSLADSIRAPAVPGLVRGCDQVNQCIGGRLGVPFNGHIDAAVESEIVGVDVDLRYKGVLANQLPFLCGPLREAPNPTIRSLSAISLAALSDEKPPQRPIGPGVPVEQAVTAYGGRKQRSTVVGEPLKASLRS